MTSQTADTGKAGFNLSKWALDHAALTRYLMFVLMLLGFASYFQLGQDEDPPFTFRAMVVRTYWPGATAQQVAEQVTDKLEEPCARFGCEAAERGARQLLTDTLDIMGVTVADAAHRNTGDKVEIFVPIDIVDRATLCAINRDLRIKGDRLQARRHRLGLAIEDRFRFRPRCCVDLAGFIIDRLRRRGAFALHDTSSSNDGS